MPNHISEQLNTYKPKQPTELQKDSSSKVNETDDSRKRVQFEPTKLQSGVFYQTNQMFQQQQTRLMKKRERQQLQEKLKKIKIFTSPRDNRKFQISKDDPFSDIFIKNQTQFENNKFISIEEEEKKVRQVLPKESRADL